MERMKILLAEDNRSHQQLLEMALLEAAADVCVVDSAAACVERLSTESFDAMVLDFNLKDARADAVLRRAAEHLRHVPVIVVSGDEAQEIVINTLRLGASDFVPKAQAVQPGVLADRVRLAIDRAVLQRRERRHEQRRIRELTHIAHTDPLTGLFNRRYVDKLLSSRRWRCDRRELIAAILVDIDHFKAINDAHGHAVGDSVLVAVAREMRTWCDHAVAVRYGGEEFLALVHVSGEGEAWRLAESLRLAIARLEVVAGTRVIRPTVSIGVVTARTDELERDAVTRADHALYLAKDEGRNRTCTWAMVELRRLVDESPCGQEPLDALLRTLLRRLDPLLGPTQRELLAEAQEVAGIAGELAGVLIPHERKRIEFAARIRGLSRAIVPEETLAQVGRLSESEAALLASADAHAAEASVRLGADAWTASAVRDAHARADGADHESEFGALGPCPAAKIMGVASAIVAMRRTRPWRSALSRDEMLSQLDSGSGHRFDAEVVTVAKALLRSDTGSEAVPDVAPA